MYRVPKKEIWIPHDLKTLLNPKKEAFQPWDWEELKRVHQNLREKPRECKRRKPEASPADKREGMCGPGWREHWDQGDREPTGSLERAELNLFNRFQTAGSCLPSFQHLTCPRCWHPTTPSPVVLPPPQWSLQTLSPHLETAPPTRWGDSWIRFTQSRLRLPMAPARGSWRAVLQLSSVL